MPYGLVRTRRTGVIINDSCEQIDYTKPNSLGDLRAEADQEMLKRVFLETADYRTLIETSD